jgi:hypothetical protein
VADHPDELLQPSIGSGKTYANPPWRVASAFVPSFFGGVGAAAIPPLLDAQRALGTRLSGS